MLSRFLRSATQATDSTLMGCNANSAATMKLRPTLAVARHRIQNSNTAFSTCSRRFESWCRPALRENNWQSKACDSQVSGCQLAA